MDSVGNLEWQTTIGGSKSDFASAIIQTIDSGFVFTGLSLSDDGDIPEHFGASDKADLIVFKLDKNGNVQWSKVFGGGSDDFGTALASTNDGNYLVCGTTNLYGYFDYWVLKLDLGGNLIWDRSYGGSDYDVAYSVLETSENNILITGEMWSDDMDVNFHHPGENPDMWVILIDSLGVILWQNSLGGTGSDIGYDLSESIDGSFTISGNTATINNGDVIGHHGGMFISDYWIVKLDKMGVIKWQRCLGGSESDHCYSHRRINDKKIVVFGHSFSYDGDVSDHYFGDTPASDIWAVQISETCDQLVYYTDADNDLFGDAENYIYSCYDTIGYVLIDGDCDDTNPNIYPDAPEILNGLDDDCNGIADDNVGVEENVNSEFYVYPNPTLNTLFIVNNYGRESTFTITNVTGQIIYISETISNKTEMDISGLSPGLYIITISAQNAFFTKEIIKQ